MNTRWERSACGRSNAIRSVILRMRAATASSSPTARPFSNQSILPRIRLQAMITRIHIVRCGCRYGGGTRFSPLLRRCRTGGYGCLLHGSVSRVGRGCERAMFLRRSLTCSETAYFFAFLIIIKITACARRAATREWGRSVWNSDPVEKRSRNRNGNGRPPTSLCAGAR